MKWHQLDHMQTICTSLQTDNHTNTSSLTYLQAGCSSWCPTNSIKALKANLTLHQNILYTVSAERILALLYPLEFSMISGARYHLVATYSVKKPVWSWFGSATRARPKSQIYKQTHRCCWQQSCDRLKRSQFSCKYWDLSANINLNFMTIKICDLALKSKDNTVAENETRIKRENKIR